MSFNSTHQAKSNYHFLHLLILVFVTLNFGPIGASFGQSQVIEGRPITPIKPTDIHVPTVILNRSAYTVEISNSTDITPFFVQPEEEVELYVADGTHTIQAVSFSEDNIFDEEITIHKQELTVTSGDTIEITDLSLSVLLTAPLDRSTWLGYREDANGRSQPIWLTFYKNGTCTMYDHKTKLMTGSIAESDIDTEEISRIFVIRQETYYPGSAATEIAGTLYEVEDMIVLDFVVEPEIIFKRTSDSEKVRSPSLNSLISFDALLNFSETNQASIERRLLQTTVPKLSNGSEFTVLSVSATFSQSTGTLNITGNAQDNNIEISRDDSGNILVNDGEVAIVGGTPNVNNTTQILGLCLGGNDTIVLNEFNGALPRAFLLGGAGNDTLIGGSGQDFILGSSGNDVIRGGNNDDRIFGGSGNDTLLGDRGNDRVLGQTGSDLLIVNNGDGSDVLEGGDGDNDTVQVNGANGAGDDFSIDPNGARVRFQRNNLGLFALDIGTTENLDVNGQGGSDVIAGSVGLNGLIELDLDGGQGNDLLIGGDGVDTLRGGAGNDTLIGRKGNDVMLGEQGNDLFVWNNGDGSDLMEGGADIDIVQVNGANGAGDDFSIDPNGARVRFQRNNLGLFALDIGTTENLDVNGQGGSDVIAGSVGLNGLIELDLDGGQGNDLLIGGDGVDTLRGGAGNDTLIGRKGNDVMLGEQGNDLFVWNNGDGSDLMEGGADIDTVQVNGANGAGDDFSIDPNGARVRFQRNNLGLFALDIGTTENLDVNGQGGSDVIAGSVGLNGLIKLDLDGGQGNDLLIGGDGVDTLRGGAGNDTLIGRKGNDVMLGEQGNDLFVWNNGDGSDLMEGGADIDTVQVDGANGAGDDFSIDPNGARVRFQRNNLGLFALDIGTTENLDVNGQGGSDVIAGSVGLNGLIKLDLDGGEGNDLLIGGDGVDTLRGGAGNDTLIGRKGNDVMLGEQGNDLFVWNNGDGSDLMEGGSGRDTVQVNGAANIGDKFVVRANGSRLRFKRNNGEPFLLDIGAIHTLDVNGLGGNDTMRVLNLSAVAKLRIIDLDGGDGDDRLDSRALSANIRFFARGGDGNDVLLGSNGVDILLGGRGDDFIHGRDGNDTAIGGDGNDTILGRGGDDVIVGNNGDDRLSGGDGDDRLFGGDGDDTLNGNAGTDHLNGGPGTDKGFNGEIQVGIP